MEPLPRRLRKDSPPYPLILIPINESFGPFFVAAYQAGAKVLRAGVTIDQVFDAWRKELVNHRRISNQLTCATSN